MTRAFFDTNILLYAVNRADTKRARAAGLLAAGGIVSVQCLNEFMSVALGKLRMSWGDATEARERLLVFFDQVLPLTVAVHEHGLRIAHRYRLSIYDAMIASAAIAGGCDTLYSEDMQHGLVISGVLTVTNPFV